MVEKRKKVVTFEEENDVLPSKKESRKCVHEGVETEEAFCCKCGLVLDELYQPDVLWWEHSLMDREYSDRLIAVDDALTKFMEKTNLYTKMPLYLIQERLRSMKFDSGYCS